MVHQRNRITYPMVTGRIAGRQNKNNPPSVRILPETAGCLKGEIVHSHQMTGSHELLEGPVGKCVGSGLVTNQQTGPVTDIFNQFTGFVPVIIEHLGKMLPQVAFFYLPRIPVVPAL